MAPEKFHIKQIPKELRKQEVRSRRGYVEWINNKLKAHYTNALEFRNGAAYIQLLHSMFPGVIPLDDVKFCASMEYDCYQNFRILEEAFKKLGIDQNLDVTALSSGRHVESWTFLKWFKMFYDANFDKKEYDPLKERNYAYMGFGKCEKNLKEDIQGTQREKRGKSLSRVRSKSVVCQRTTSHRYSSEKELHKMGKPSRSVECLLEKEDEDFDDGRSASPLAIRKFGTDRFIYKGKQKFAKAAFEFKKENPEDEEDTKSTLNSPCNGGKLQKNLVSVKKGSSQGDFEPKISKSDTETPGARSTHDSNLNTIVINKSQKYEELGVRISENIQIRIEKTKDIDSAEKSHFVDSEKRRQMYEMIERYLKFQWNERKEYFQILAGFLREDDKRASK